MPDSVTRTDCESYTVIREYPDGKWHTWACFAVDSVRWILHVCSDYGGWSYRWHVEEGRSFKQLLLKMHEEYLHRKLCKGQRKHFNLEATVKRIKGIMADMIKEKRTIKVYGKDVLFKGDVRKEAQADLELIKEEYGMWEDVFVTKCIEDMPWLYEYVVDGLAVREYDPACGEMIRLLWPMFRDELIRERTVDLLWPLE